MIMESTSMHCKERALVVALLVKMFLTTSIATDWLHKQHQHQPQWLRRLQLHHLHRCKLLLLLLLKLLHDLHSATESK
jgi:hypothetical protein